MSKNHAKINDFGATGVPKSTKMVPGSDLGKRAIPGRRIKRKTGLPPKNYFRPFDAPWPLLADFGGISKTGRAPKTVQKNQYGRFLVPPSDPRTGNNGFWKTFGESVKNLSKIKAEMGGRGNGKSLIFHCFSNSIAISATFEKDRKLDGNGEPK